MTRRSGGCSSRAARTARSPRPGTARRPQQGRRALRGARGRGAGPDRGRARHAGPPGRVGRPPRAPAALTASRFDRELDRRWRRTSYSDLTAAAHEARVAASPRRTSPTTSRSRDPAAGRPRRRRRAARGPVAARGDAGRGGHRHVRARRARGGRLRGARPDRGAAPGSPRRGRGASSSSATWRHGRGAARGARDAARRARRRPAARRRPRADRLDELAFELPLAGGDRPRGRVALDAIAAALEAHLPAGDPLAGYAARLRDPALRRDVRGYLTGSIDLVVRVGDAYAIADYKTNWLAAPGEPLTAWQYRPAALAPRWSAPLRAAGAALHRRAAPLPALAAARLRPGPPPRRRALPVRPRHARRDTPVVDGAPCGVFAWTPPAALVTALSDLLEGGA